MITTTNILEAFVKAKEKRPSATLIEIVLAIIVILVPLLMLNGVVFGLILLWADSLFFHQNFFFWSQLFPFAIVFTTILQLVKQPYHHVLCACVIGQVAYWLGMWNGNLPW